MSRNRKKGFLASYKLLSCIFIIASLHHISCGIVIIHLTLANSQGEVCDEAEAIYYTFGPGKAQKMGGAVDARQKSRNPKYFQVATPYY